MMFLLNFIIFIKFSKKIKVIVVNHEVKQSVNMIRTRRKNLMIVHLFYMITTFKVTHMTTAYRITES